MKKSQFEFATKQALKPFNHASTNLKFNNLFLDIYVHLVFFFFKGY